MNRTYAPTGIVIGVLLGLLISLQTDSEALGIVAAIVLSVVFYIGIRKGEELMGKGITKAADEMTKKMNEAKGNTSGKVDNNEKGDLADRFKK